MERLLKEIIKIALIVIVIGSCTRTDNYLKKEENYRANAGQDSTLRSELFGNAEDSILKWISRRYEDVYHLSPARNNWVLDSFIVFNSNRNRGAGIIMEQLGEKSELDAIKYVDFEKKDGKWFVFFGATIVLPRECYEKHNIQCKPIHMDTLRKEGRQYLLGSYYARKWPWSKEYVINERWFRNEFEVTWSEQGKRDWISGKSRKRVVDTPR